MKYEDTLLKDICCPFCKANEGRSLHKVTASDSATHFVLPWRNYSRHKELEKHIQDLWKQSTCQVVLCQSCSGAFSWPFTAGDKLFYDLAYDRERYPQEKWEYKRALDWLLHSVQPSELSKINVLEIGAGDGAFLKKLIASGIKSENISALEYSEAGKKRLDCLNLDFVTSSDIPSNSLLEIWKKKFDFIFMFQVLEHLDDLDGKLTFLYSCIRDEGRVIFAVPNFGYISFNEASDALLDMPPNHISRFNESSIRELASRNSFEVESVESEPLNRLQEFKQFCISRYYRKAQTPHTIASIISRITYKKLKRLFEVLYIGLTLPINAIYLSKIKFSSSQLAVIQKTGRS